MTSVNIIKINNKEWVIVPYRNTNTEIIDIYQKLPIDEFKKLMEDFIIDDKNDKPDILTATAIVRTYIYTGEIIFELFELI